MPCSEQVYNYYATQRNSGSASIVTAVSGRGKKIKTSIVLKYTHSFIMTRV